MCKCYKFLRYVHIFALFWVKWKSLKFKSNAKAYLVHNEGLCTCQYITYSREVLNPPEIEFKKCGSISCWDLDKWRYGDITVHDHVPSECFTVQSQGPNWQRGLTNLSYESALVDLWIKSVFTKKWMSWYRGYLILSLGQSDQSIPPNLIQKLSQTFSWIKFDPKIIAILSVSGYIIWLCPYRYWNPKLRRYRQYRQNKFLHDKVRIREVSFSISRPQHGNKTGSK